MLADGSYDSSDIVENFLVWFSLKFTCVGRRLNLLSGVFEYKFWRGMKRGDALYAWRVRCRVGEVVSRLPDVKYFDFGVRGHISSRCLAVALTYRRDIGLYDAWSHLGKDLNGFLCALRRRFGKVAVYRVFESHLDGYPHVHLLILFKEYSFDGSSYRGIKGGLSYKVFDKDSIGKLWSHGFSKVYAMSSVRAGFGYCGKYLEKSVSVPNPVVSDSDKKALLTLSYGWVFRVRAFGLSGDWSPSLDLNENNKNISNVVSIFPLTYEDVLYEPWRLVGFYRGDHALLNGFSGRLSDFDFRVLSCEPDYRGLEDEVFSRRGS